MRGFDQREETMKDLIRSVDPETSPAATAAPAIRPLAALLARLAPRKRRRGMALRPLRAAAAAIAVASFAGSAAVAQWSTGSLVGRVIDPSSAPITGAAIRLDAAADPNAAPAIARTNDRGQFSLLGLAPGVYSLTVAVDGYLPALSESITVLAGQPTSVQVQMSPVPGETVTVTAEPPSGLAAAMPSLVLNRAELDRTPSAREPWSLASRAPGVLTLGINNGGSEAGQQFMLFGGGAGTSETSYQVDGVRVTDMLTVGATIVYFDFDQFDEIGVTTGAFDLTSGNAGVSVQLTTRRASGDWRGSARYLSSDGTWQADGDERQQELATRVRSIAEYGLEGGGPLAGEFLAGWLALGRSDIDRRSAAGAPVDIGLEQKAAKLEGTWGRTSYSLLGQTSEKVWNGRGAASNRAPETTMVQSGPFDLGKLAITTLVSADTTIDLSISGTRGDLRSTPRGSGDIWVGIDGVWHGGFLSSLRDSSSDQQQLEASSVLRWGRQAFHLRAGAQRRRQEDAFNERWGDRRTIAWRQSDGTTVMEAVQSGRESLNEAYEGAWLGAALQLPRLALQAGVRYDRQSGSTRDTEVAAHPLFPEFLPAFRFDGDDYGFAWRTVSPRIAATYAFGDQGDSVLCLAAARFPSQLSGRVGVWQVSSASRTGYLQFVDLDGDLRLDDGEPTGERWLDPAMFRSGSVDPGLGAELYDSLSVGFDRRLGPLTGSVEFVRRRHHEILEERLLVAEFDKTRGVGGVGDTGVRQAVREDYVPAGHVAGNLPDGSSYDVPYFSLRPGLETRGTLLVNGDRERIYQAVTLSLERPRSDQWSLRANLTLADWSWRLGPEFRRHDDPTNQAPGESTSFGVDNSDDEGGIAGSFGTAASGQGVLANARWSYSVVTRVEIAPTRAWGFDVALSLTGRDGYPLALAQRVVTPSKTGLVQITPRADDFRSDAVHLADLRLERALRWSKWGGLETTFGIDVFNLTGSSAALSSVRLQGYRLGEPAEVLSPRTWRAGVRLRWD
jgi:hypothetical protein